MEKEARAGKENLCGPLNEVKKWKTSEHSVVFKKGTVWESRVKFYSGQNEDHSQEMTAPQTALRNCPEEAGRKVSNIWDFDERGVHEVKHILFQKISGNLMKLLPVTRNSHHHEVFLVFF